MNGKERKNLNIKTPVAVNYWLISVMGSKRCLAVSFVPEDALTCYHALLHSPPLCAKTPN
jgi:hypothetical protein